MTTTLTVLYFASLRERTGVASESVTTVAVDLSGLYGEVQARHGIAWPREHLRVAVDGEFARWQDSLRTGSEVAFIPPVSGG
ncbi:molybdopterin synthase subunit MoaD [Pseudoxanthomonas sp. CF385]|uniref:MoaD/ThiS family protein n=1 Tax=Pseudoxanthomonas sp. CF385 TaxID=1881042 RepID=UPI00088CC89E|nr:MoaD/ThiS family protein [Pseudoxanthomonas sp. CF385]SDQ55059.1 molybdopterin synthase subunit MoaD [Pseudoxanthomonas sp. CF385]